MSGSRVNKSKNISEKEIDKGRNETDTMNKIIDIINKIQTYSRRDNRPKIDFPEIVVIGAQSTGKSSILERIINIDVLPKDKETCTKCPIILQLSSRDNQQEILADFSIENNQHLLGESTIRRKLLEISNGLKEFSENPIIIKLTKKDFPQITLVDLPGLIKNSPTGKDQHVNEIEKLAEQYAKLTTTIILAVSAANVDLANSDSIRLSRKFDQDGSRTFHVITKIDLMDKGTDARDLLKNDFLSKSLGVILLKNRSQQSLTKNESIDSVFDLEKKFLEENYPEISAHHGIRVLTSKLLNIFHNKIRRFLPKIIDDIQDRKSELQKDIKRFDKSDREMPTLIKYVDQFKKIYREIINGDKVQYSNELSGGALISIAIYDKFEKEINDLQIDKFQQEILKKHIRNTAGNKQAPHSNDKPYINLSEQQIEKIKNPIEKTLQDVKGFLELFVKQTINEMNISKFYNLILWFDKNMQEFIKINFENTDKIIKSLIDCEKNNVSCSYPINTKLKSDTIDSIPTVIDSNIVFTTANAALPGYVAKALEVINQLGLLDKVKQNLNSFIFKALFETEKYEEQDDLMKHEEEIKNYINKNGGIKKVHEFWENNMKNRNDDNENLIIKMVADNFKAVKANIICNFPKWIQKFMIQDLLQTMDTLLKSEDASHLLKIDEVHKNNLAMLQNELKEIEAIESELDSCMKDL